MALTLNQVGKQLPSSIQRLIARYSGTPVL